LKAHTTTKLNKKILDLDQQQQSLSLAMPHLCDEIFMQKIILLANKQANCTNHKTFLVEANTPDSRLVLLSHSNKP